MPAIFRNDCVYLLIFLIIYLCNLANMRKDVFLKGAFWRRSWHKLVKIVNKHFAFNVKQTRMRIRLIQRHSPLIKTWDFTCKFRNQFELFFKSIVELRFFYFLFKSSDEHANTLSWLLGILEIPISSVCYVEIHEIWPNSFVSAMSTETEGFSNDDSIQGLLNDTGK